MGLNAARTWQGLCEYSLFLLAMRPFLARFSRRWLMQTTSSSLSLSASDRHVPRNTGWGQDPASARREHDRERGKDGRDSEEILKEGDTEAHGGVCVPERI